MRKRTNNFASAAIILALSLVFAFTVQGIHTLQERAEAAAPVETEPTQPVTETEPVPTQTEDDGWKAPPSIKKAPEGYFDTALFIGDSRTVGLANHGGISGATFFAHEGLSVWTLPTDKVEIEGLGMVTLEELLDARKFDTIYLMTGINELVTNLDDSIAEYKNRVEKIREQQPDAIIILGASLHVSQQVSETKPVFRNDKIQKFNEAIYQLEDGWNIFYIDVNELFDNGAGYLDSSYSSDGIHPYGKYYIAWGDWIKERAVVKAK